MSHTEAIQQTATDLLTSGTVSCVIGYEVGPRGRTRPVFVYTPEDADRLVWNNHCTHNLAVYLPQKLKTAAGQAGEPVAVVVKPCDSRAIQVQLAENQITRDLVHVIGVACEGIVTGAGQRQPAASAPLQNRCQQCTSRKPVIYDTLIGEPPAIEPVDGGNGYARLETMSPAERMDYWLSQFDRCIRCYACRQACPMCNCPTCLYERDDSMWAGMKIGLSEKRTFHLGRAFHLAGRCISCDECERVCPVNVPISQLNRKLADTMRDLYQHEAGLEPVLSPITTILREQER